MACIKYQVGSIRGSVDVWKGGGGRQVERSNGDKFSGCGKGIIVTTTTAAEINAVIIGFVLRAVQWNYHQPAALRPLLLILWASPFIALKQRPNQSQRLSNRIWTHELVEDLQHSSRRWCSRLPIWASVRINKSEEQTNGAKRPSIRRRVAVVGASLRTELTIRSQILKILCQMLLFLPASLLLRC